MNMDKLNHFIKVCEYKNMTKAADALFISQSALSQSIRSLEEELGHPLFIRSKKNLVLNDQGVIVLQYAKRIMNLTNEMQLAVENSYGLSDPIRIASDVYAMYTLLSANFMLEHPEITVENIRPSKKSYADMILDKDCDVTITLEPIDLPEIQCQFFHRDIPYVLVPEDSIFYGCEYVSPADLKGCSFYRNRDLLTNSSIFAGGAADAAVRQWNLVEVRTTYVDMDVMRLLWKTSTHFFFCSSLSICVNSELRQLDRKRFVRFKVAENKMREYWISASKTHGDNIHAFLSWCMNSKPLHQKFLDPFS